MIDSLRLPMTTTSMNSDPSPPVTDAESLTKQHIRRAFPAVHCNLVVAAMDEKGMPEEGTRGRGENNGARRVENTGSSIEIDIIAPPRESLRMQKEVRSHRLKKEKIDEGACLPIIIILEEQKISAGTMIFGYSCINPHVLLLNFCFLSHFILNCI